MRTGLTKQEKTTDIWFDEKDPLIHIRTHNTDLKKRLLAYSRRYPAICQQTDADPETGLYSIRVQQITLVIPQWTQSTHCIESNKRIR